MKRAHVVSKGYLRAWAGTRNLVDVVDLQRGHPFRTSIENATVANYAYDPKVLSRDLEAEYAQIERVGLPAIVKLRHGHAASSLEWQAVLAFLDMHLERGRFADQIDVLTPAVVLKTDGTIEDADLNSADRLMLTRFHRDFRNLKGYGIDQWPWRVRSDLKQLATGDGAVLQWRSGEGREASTVTFPLSPTHLLEIGERLSNPWMLNARLEANSRRWLIATPGTFVEMPSTTS